MASTMLLTTKTSKCITGLRHRSEESRLLAPNVDNVRAYEKGSTTIMKAYQRENTMFGISICIGERLAIIRQALSVLTLRSSSGSRTSGRHARRLQRHVH